MMLYAENSVDMKTTHVHIVYHPRGSWADMCIAVVFHPLLRQCIWSLEGTARPRIQLSLRDRVWQVKLCLHTVPGGTAFCSILVQRTPDLQTTRLTAVIVLLATEVVMMVNGSSHTGFEVQCMFDCFRVTNLRLILRSSSPILTVSELLNISYTENNLLTLITAEPFVPRQASASSISCNSTVAYSMNAVANYMERWTGFTE